MELTAVSLHPSTHTPLSLTSPLHLYPCKTGKNYQTRTK